MYALIRQYEGLDATTRETATKKANLELRPILTKAPGFVSYELVEPEDKDGAVTSISVFDTRTHAEDSGKLAVVGGGAKSPSFPTPCLVAGERVALSAPPARWARAAPSERHSCF